MDEYKPEKAIWTEEDFDLMGWHDTPVHAISFSDNFELLFDIDYIFEWELKGGIYNFWVAPCTLLFENVYDLNFDIGPSTPGLTIDTITRVNPCKPRNGQYINRELEFDWNIEMVEGEIAFKSVGFKQYIRALPAFLTTQKIPMEKRGGVSFNRFTF
ncbi:hypothetical protein [Desertivirga brevis]|uniref:hypothetical protein n=1 Tax=Desertivirga brevis TaxID=2810310 RepID=UPI001A967BC8|nr:hypothetical protein [Pedobacter sp. SYSU D00873]